MLRNGFFIIASTFLIASFVLQACEFTTANIKRAVMAKELNDDKSPAVETTRFFGHENLLHCAVQVANAPSGTLVKAIWYLKHEDDEREEIAETELELDESAWIDFSLTLSRTLPYGEYEVELFIQEQHEQTVPFSIVPMFEESVIKEAVMAKSINEDNFPVEVTKTFPSGINHVFAPVYVTDQDAGSVFSAIWYQHDEEGNRSLITSADIEFDDAGWIAFSMTLQGGLPPGDYSADILYNGIVEHTLQFSAQ